MNQGFWRTLFRYWHRILQILGCVCVIIGLLGPWFWQGHDQIGMFNPSTRKMETQYTRIVEVSPLYAREVTEGVVVRSYWFFEFNLSQTLSLSAFVFILGLSLCTLQAGLNKYTILGVCSLIVAALLFFLSFGGGIGLGYRTFVGWGFWVTSLGGAVILTPIILDQFLIIY